MGDISLGPSGLIGWNIVYSSTSFNMTTSAQTIFQQSTGDGSYPAVNLSGGAYDIYILWDRSGNGLVYDGHWTGKMYWYGSGTNAADASDIFLHGSAHSFNGITLYARTQMTFGNSNNLRFQVWASSAETNDTFRVYVRRAG